MTQHLRRSATQRASVVQTGCKLYSQYLIDGRAASLKRMTKVANLLAAAQRHRRKLIAETPHQEITVLLVMVTRLQAGTDVVITKTVSLSCLMMKANPQVGILETESEDGPEVDLDLDRGQIRL